MTRTDDPGHDWKVYCDMQERAYKELIRDKTCRDCGKCEISPDDDSKWGWCRDIGEYVTLDDLVGEIDCEGYEE